MFKKYQLEGPAKGLKHPTTECLLQIRLITFSLVILAIKQVFSFFLGGGGRVDSVLKPHMLVELQDWSRGGEGQFHFFVQLYIYIRPNSFRIMPLIELSSQLR